MTKSSDHFETPPTEQTRTRMQNQRRRDTGCELAVRRILHASGLRYRVDCRPEPSLRRRADIVFTKRRIAVFIDGCFWHGCPDHGTTPHSNADWWLSKIERNKTRDLDTNARLKDAGWTVLRFWEHESPDSVAQSIIDSVRKEGPI
jgi:DNA mismatch endonuclease (patch repair protein)